jgi:hypothetical protein
MKKRSFVSFASSLPIVASMLMACGAPPVPSVPKDPTTSASSPKPVDPTPPVASAKPAKDKHELAEEAAHVDPNEKEGPIELAALVQNPAKTTYPKATIGDHECLKGGLSFTGSHKADYQSLVAQCGTPTGMVAYTTPHEGRLHATHDKRDHFIVKVSKGQCYRYFAVADDGIKDIDILVLKNGALIATDHTTHPIAVIDSDKLWCVDDDMTLDFAVEVDGRGAGGYTFGVWTRPKK